MTKRLPMTIFFTVLMLCCWGQASDSSVVKKVQLPIGFTSQIDVVYTKVKDWEGKMDIYLPPAKDKKPTAIVINIHGGGWNHGTKEEQNGFSSFFKNEMAVANIEYRLTPQATAPAAVEDVRCALIYIIEHAIELNIDKNKIVVMGGSAGGHLALMAGMLENNHLFDTNCGTTQNIEVAAIIDKYGITDVWDWGYGKDLTSSSATKWLGKYAKDENFAKSVSPISYVKKSTVPTLIIHGDADPTVPYQQSVKLYDALKKAGVVTEMITVPGGLHGKFNKETNSNLNKKIIAFINQQIDKN